MKKKKSLNIYLYTFSLNNQQLEGFRSQFCVKLKKNLTPSRSEKNCLDKNTPSSRCSDDTIWPLKCLH